MSKSFRSLEVYEHSKKLVLACYELTHDLPADEKSNLAKYIRTAALCAHLNIAQGIFLKSKKKKKFLTKAKNALLVIDAAFEIMLEVGFCTKEEAEKCIRLSSACYQQIDK